MSNCKSGRLFPAIPHKRFPIEGLECNVCKGTGYIPDNDYDPSKGRSMKEDRINRRVSLRDEAKRLSIDVTDLSLMERGIFKRKDE